MNKRYYLLLASVFLMISAFVHGQSIEPKISFDESVYDFGEIKEDGGKVEHEFKFTNIGSKPLIITNVQSSCGCTTPTWSNAPVLPGNSGYVKAVFDPNHRPNAFNKSITVYSNDPSGRTVLRIIGKVLPKALPITQQYPYNMGDLLLKNQNQSMLSMTNTEVKTKEIEVYNNGNEPLKISFKDMPEPVSAKAIPSTLEPKQKGKIEITYDASKKDDYDYVRDWFYVKINGKSDPNDRIMVTAKITEDFSNLSDQDLANAPVAVFSNTTFNFGTIKEGETVEYDFPIENQGKSNLIIRKIKTTCGCTAAMPKKQVIAPGEKTYIHATFNSAHKVGNNYKPITVITNSPDKPSQTLAVKGIVVKAD